jgi:FAD/FMN-containing dehydrogenase
VFWGLRGGGGNFGVATSLEFQLHPLEQVVGGRLVFAGAGVPEVLRRFRDLVASDPIELSCSAVLAVDDSLQPILIVAPCYTGTDGDPDGLRALRSAPGLVFDGVRRHGFIAQQHVFNPPYGADRNYWKSSFALELPDELIDELVRRIGAMGRPPGQVLLESLHGAPKANGDGAIGFRHAAFNVSAMATWLDPDLDDEYIAWARDTASAVEPWSVSGGYVNYMQADEPIERVRAAFGDETFARLQALKARYDPGNMLRRNQNIPPA